MAEVFSSDLAAGHHSFVWNGCNADGVAVPSGIYFGRIEHITVENERTVRTIKMNLIR
jgi:flagellar hook assembly protein FlgD